jgi:hypothetical protein
MYDHVNNVGSTLIEYVRQQEGPTDDKPNESIGD